MSGPTVTVRLLGLPVAAHVEARRHVTALRRELTLIRHRAPDGSGIPERLLALLEELNDRYGSLAAGTVAELDAAIDRGDETVDLAFELPVSAADAARRMLTVLDEVDDYCRTQRYLLTLVSSALTRRYRRWFLGEFVGQAAGRAPVPWSPDAPEDADAGDDGPAPAPDDQPSHGPAPNEPAPDGPAPNEPAPDEPAPNEPAPDAPELDGPAGWRLERTGEATTLGIDGVLDLETAPRLRELLVQVLDGGAPLIVDLRHCRFVDSVGVSVLVAALLRATEQGVPVRFRLSPTARRVFEIGGLIDHVTVDDGDDGDDRDDPAPGT